MSRFLFVLVLTWVGTDAKVVRSLSSALFTQGSEYVYEWEASVSLTPTESTNHDTSTHLRGQLNVLFKNEGADSRALFSLSNVTVCVRHASKSAGSKFAKWDDLNIRRPFQLIYSATKVKGIVLSDEDPTWFANFKRSIASLFQINVQRGPTYDDQELTIYGKCAVRYEMFQSRKQLKKETNFSSCDGKFDRQSFGLQSSIGMNGTTWYSVSQNEQNVQINEIRTVSFIVHDPFEGISNSSVVFKTNASFKLKSKSNSSTFDSLVKGDWTRFKSLNVPEEVTSEAVDLKMARSAVHLSQVAARELEYIRMKTLMDLFSMAESGGSAERGIDPASVSLQLGSLDYGSVAVLHRELAATVGNKKYEHARQLFWDLLIQSGSSAGIVFLRDSIRTNQLDEWKAAQLVTAAAIHAQHPSQKLLQIFQSMMDDEVEFSEKIGIFRNAATLAFTIQLKKVCENLNDRRKCFGDWQQKFYQYLNASSSFGERGLYVHALANVGYGVVLDQMIHLAAAHSHQEHDNYLRVYVIHGLNECKKERKVARLLVKLLMDQQEDHQVRIAAASVLLRDPSADLLRQVGDWLSDTLGMSRDLRHFLRSWLRSIAQSHSHHLQHLVPLASEMIDSLPAEASSTKYSSAWALDFVQVSSPVGARLQVQTTAGQFDDLPSFIDAKLNYFTPDAVYEPFSLTLRMTKVRKYLTSLWDWTLRHQEFHPDQLRQVAEALRMAARRERHLSFDVALAAHGRTLLFYHVDQRLWTDRTPLTPWRNLDKILDVSFGHQSWLSVSRFQQQIPNALAIPIRRMFDLRLMTRSRSAIRKPLASLTTFAGSVDARFYGELYAEHGLMMDVAPLGVSMGLMRQSHVSVNLPLSVHLSTEIKSLKEFHFDLRYRLPTASNSLEANYSSRTALKFHASESGRQLCPGCPSRFTIRNPSAPDKTETIFDYSSSLTGVQVVAQVSDCDTNNLADRARPLVEKIVQNMQSAQMPFVLAVPQCSFKIQMAQWKRSPVTEIVSHLKVRTDWNDAMERALRQGKTTVKGHVTFRGQTSRDRTGEIDLVHEFKWTRSQMNVLIRLPAHNQSHWLICLRSEENRTPMDHIWNAEQPPSVHYGVEWAMGMSTHPNQCPKNQFRFKVNIKASAGDWVMARRDEASTWPYRLCQQQRADWMTIVPQTEACYRSAVDFTSLSNYNVDIICAGIPLSSTMNYATDAIQTSFNPFITFDSPSNTSNSGVERLSFNASFRPDRPDQRVLDLNVTLQSKTHQLEIQIPKQLPFRLPSLAASIEHEAFPSCLVTSQYIQSLDNVTWSNQFTDCYSLLSSDCGTSPSFAVFGRKASGSFPLAVKVNIGADVMELSAEESGKLAVRVNGREIDFRRTPFTIPEGRLHFYAIKITFQHPNVVIWSPAAGISVEYSGVHVAIRPVWIQRSQLCGLCGNFDGEPANDWTDPQGCRLADPSHVIAAYTVDRSCFPNVTPISFCPQS